MQDIELEKPGTDKLMRVIDAYNIITNFYKAINSAEPLSLIQKCKLQHEIYLWLLVIIYKKTNTKVHDVFFFHQEYILQADIQAALDSANYYITNETLIHAANKLK